MPIIEAIKATNIAAPSIEKSLSNEGLGNATDRELELCSKAFLWLSEAWELAKIRGYPSTEVSFNKNYDAQKLGKKYGIDKLEEKRELTKNDKKGIERTYHVRGYRNSKNLNP